MNLLFLDLEMNQPSGKIIQVGWTIGDPVTGRSYVIEGSYVHIFEDLNPTISNLCGIQQDVLVKAPVLIDVYKKMLADTQKYNCHSQVVTWGGNDLSVLYKQIELYIKDMSTIWIFSRNVIDCKNIYQSWKLKQQNPHLKGGLARALTKFNLTFQGRKHNAKDDAYNTFKMYSRLLQEFK